MFWLNSQDMANYTCVAENIAGRRESEVAVLSVYVNGGWSEWSAWASCRCNGAVSGRRRSRSCTEPAPANGGAPCRGAGAQTDEECLRCQSGEYLSLQRAVSGRRLSRSCTEPAPANGGAPCRGAGAQTDEYGDCLRVRRRQCAGSCSGSTQQHASCVDGLCSNGL
ncbi:Unc-5, partial [Operophtera brumata]